MQNARPVCLLSFFEACEIMLDYISDLLQLVPGANPVGTTEPFGDCSVPSSSHSAGLDRHLVGPTPLMEQRGWTIICSEIDFPFTSLRGACCDASSKPRCPRNCKCRSPKCSVESADETGLDTGQVAKGVKFRAPEASSPRAPKLYPDIPGLQ